MFRFVIELSERQKMAHLHKFRINAKSFATIKNQISYFSSRCLSSNTHGSDGDMPPVPERIVRHNETLEVRKARLLYQSRKRGMLENGLLLSTFAAKYLKQMSEVQTIEYDNLINKPSNDWEIYYWAIGNKPTPEEFDGEVMNLLKEHAQNNDQDSRIRQPDL